MKKTDGMIERLYGESEDPQEVIEALCDIYHRSPTNTRENKTLNTWRLSDLPEELRKRWLSANSEKERRQIIDEYHMGG